MTDEFNREWRFVLTHLKLELIKVLHGDVAQDSLNRASEEFISFASANESILNYDDTARNVAFAFADGFASLGFPDLTVEEMARRLLRLSESLDIAIAKTWAITPVKRK